MEDRFQQALEDCIELLGHGASVEDCLARYSEYAQELEPLLHTALTARTQLTPGMSSGAKARVRSQVMAEWDHRHLPRQRRWSLPSFLPRWAAVAASVVLAIGLGGASTVAAAGGAVPGQLLYPVKELREGAQLWFAQSPESKVAVYSRLVKERAKEIRELTATEHTGSSLIALARLEGHVSDVNNLTGRQIGLSGDASLAADSGLVERLKEVISEQKAAEAVVQKALQQAPAEVRPKFQDALKAIQAGRDRVRSAIESIGHPSPLQPAP